MNKKDFKGLYIHIPFCRQKCLYCDFPSFAGREALMHEYAETLAEEIRSFDSEKFNTIFIGGGTPTYLPLETLKMIGPAIRGLNTAEDTEFTVECNPGTLDEEKLQYLKDLGVNRLSIGLQAWQDCFLKELGRIHSLEEFLNSYKMARGKGFNNINIDIMFALPGQATEEYLETLRNVIRLKPEHLSCYSLIIEDNTTFGTMNKNGLLKLPDEDEAINMYEAGVELLKSEGYLQYEISNFAREGFECRHNLKYWNMEEYIGCGAAAHSYMNHIRYNNKSDIEEYIAAIKTGSTPAAEHHKNSAEDEIEEFIFLGLRKIKGISENEFKERFGTDIYSVYGKVMEKYERHKLILKKDGQIYLSSKGIEISNSILSDFILT